MSFQKEKEFDERILRLRLIAKKLLAENPESLPIYAVGCLLEDGNADHAEIEYDINVLLKIARESPDLLECTGNPCRQQELVPLMCSAGGFAVPGLTEKKVFSGADATITREDTKRLLEDVGKWPLKKGSFLQPWFVGTYADTVTDNKFTEANYIRKPKRKPSEVMRLVRQVIGEFLAKESRVPTHAEVFQHIVNNANDYDQVKKTGQQFIEVKGAPNTQGFRSIRRVYQNCFTK